MGSHVYASSSIGEGHSTNRPPLFKGVDFIYWKTRMSLHIQSVSFDIWNIIQNGNVKIPTLVDKDGIVSVKEPKDYLGYDYEILQEQWNAKVTAIQDAKDLTKMSLDELLGSLLTHEIIISNRIVRDHEVKREFAFKGSVDQDDRYNDSDDEDFARMITKFQRLIENRRSVKSREKDRRDSKADGVIRSRCPRFIKNKSFDETANLCFYDSIDRITCQSIGPPVDRSNLLPIDRTTEFKAVFFMAHQNNKVRKYLVNKRSWFMDIECSNQIIEDSSRFKTFNQRHEENVTFGDNSKRIIWYEYNKPRYISTNCPKLAKEDNRHQRRKALKASTWDDSNDSSGDEKNDETANICLVSQSKISIDIDYMEIDSEDEESLHHEGKEDDDTSFASKAKFIDMDGIIEVEESKDNAVDKATVENDKASVGNLFFLFKYILLVNILDNDMFSLHELCDSGYTINVKAANCYIIRPR